MRIITTVLSGQKGLRDIALHARYPLLQLIWLQYRYYKVLTTLTITPPFKTTSAWIRRVKELIRGVIPLISGSVEPTGTRDTSFRGLVTPKIRTCVTGALAARTQLFGSRTFRSTELFQGATPCPRQSKFALGWIRTLDINQNQRLIPPLPVLPSGIPPKNQRDILWGLQRLCHQAKRD